MDKINSWLERIDRITNSFESEFRDLRADELNWKTNQQVWSIAQIMEHLNNTTDSYLPPIENARSVNYKLPFTAKIPGFPSLLGKTILKTVSPENRKKTKTFPVWQPSSGNVSADILDQFVLHQTTLKKLVENSYDLLNKETIISSPANKYIVYRLDTAFDILVSHEERHLRQAMEIKELIKNKFAS